MSTQFTKALVVSPLADGKTWVLLDSFCYEVGHLGSGDTVTVPVLFLTDFASIPRPIWPVFPQWGKYGNAAIVHDFGYWTQTRPRAEVDRIFLEGMKVLGVSGITRTTIYAGVRLFGWIAWWHDRHRKKKGVVMMAEHLPEKSTDEPAQVR